MTGFCDKTVLSIYQLYRYHVLCRSTGKRYHVLYGLSRSRKLEMGIAIGDWHHYSLFILTENQRTPRRRECRLSISKDPFVFTVISS